MNRIRAIAIADRAAPIALRLVAAGNMLFLVSFLAALVAAVGMAHP
jgi:hypothetical protein